MNEQLLFLIKHTALISFEDTNHKDVRLNMKMSGRSVMAFEGTLESVVERAHDVLSAALPKTSAQ
jgi:hypothetical protein